MKSHTVKRPVVVDRKIIFRDDNPDRLYFN